MIDLLYSADNEAQATVLGYNTTSPYAVCTVNGPDLTMAEKQSVEFKMVTNRHYFVTCKLADNTPADGRYSQVFLQVNPGGAYASTLYHRRNESCYGVNNVSTDILTVSACDRGYLNLVCRQGTIKIKTAIYGGPDPDDGEDATYPAAAYPNFCPGWAESPPCVTGYVSRLQLIKAKCNGARSCRIFGTTKVYGGDLGEDPCSPNQKVLYVEYSCA